jgi:LysR family transcriptional activator of nhaA
VEFLNYHHLRYFWMVARAGSLKRAAEKLHVSQPSISAQVRELEEFLGEPLFRRAGRAKVLTDAGQIALRYAEEIFGLGEELVNAIRQRPSARELRLHVGVADSFPKPVINRILEPVFSMPPKVHAILREGKLEDLLVQLAAHRLDLVLADEPASGGVKARLFSHPLGGSGVSFCATPALAARLRKGFPQSLHQAPALMPAEETPLRRAVEKWFQDRQIKPRVIADFEDAAMMCVVAADGKGFVPLPTLVAQEALKTHRLQRIGDADGCVIQFFLLTAERRIQHPAVALMTRSGQKQG